MQNRLVFLGIGCAIAIGGCLWWFADFRCRVLLLNTATLSAATCAISVPIGTLLAMMLTRTDLPGRRVFAVLIGVLLFVPLYVQVAAWQAGFGLLGWYTVANQGVAWVEGWRGTIWVHSLTAIPWVMLIVAVALRYVEPELEEEALLEGSPAQVFWKVTLRRAAAGIGAAALWVAVSSAGEMTITDLFQIRTYAEELYTQTAIGGDIGSAPLRVWPGMALTACLVFAGLALCQQLAPPAAAAPTRPRHVFQLRSWRWPALAVVLLIMALLWLVPVGNLVYQAGMVVAQTTEGRERHWSPAKLLEVMIKLRFRYKRELADTAVVGFGAATAALAIAAPLAWLARRGGWRGLPALLVSAALVAIPGPVFGVSLIWLMNRPDQPWLVALYDDRFFAPIVALTARALPLAILVLWHALRSVPAETLEMAATQGAGPLRRWLRIGLPQRWAALPVAWLVALAVAWGDLGTSVLVVPPGTNTLAILISGLSHFGVDDQLAGISLCVLATCATVGLSVLGLSRKLEP